MKFVKTIVTVAAISLLTVPAMAGNGAAQKGDCDPAVCQWLGDGNPHYQLMARGGNGNSGGNRGVNGNGGGNRGGNGSGMGPGSGSGMGPGDGTGNGGNGPKDCTGYGALAGECIND